MLQIIDTMDLIVKEIQIKIIDSETPVDNKAEINYDQIKYEQFFNEINLTAENSNGSKLDMT